MSERTAEYVGKVGGKILVTGGQCQVINCGWGKPGDTAWSSPTGLEIKGAHIVWDGMHPEEHTGNVLGLCPNHYQMFQDGFEFAYDGDIPGLRNPIVAGGEEGITFTTDELYLLTDMFEAFTGAAVTLGAGLSETEAYLTASAKISAWRRQN